MLAAKNKRLKYILGVEWPEPNENVQPKQKNRAQISEMWSPDACKITFQI